MPLQRSESSSCRPLHRVSPRSGPFRWGPVYRLTGQLSGADAKFLAGFMAKNFVAGASHPDRWNGRGYVCPRKVHSGKQAAGVAAGGRTAAPSGAVSSHTVRCAGSAGHGATGGRDRNGRCKPGFHASDRSGSPKPRQRVRRRLAGAPAAARRSRA